MTVSNSLTSRPMSGALGVEITGVDLAVLSDPLVADGSIAQFREHPPGSRDKCH
jgi:hypothetical protein